MLRVKTTIGPSKIHGIGLFANQLIPKGTLIWEFDEGLDTVVREEDLADLPEDALEQVLNFTYIDKNSRERVFCADNICFNNHSINPNLIHLYEGRKHGRSFAVRDIKKGEEITVDYWDFELEPSFRGSNSMRHNHQALRVKQTAASKQS
jgi:SET domain-containing protein